MVYVSVTFVTQILSMIEEAAGTRMYESKRASAQKTIEKKDSKLKEIDVVSIKLRTYCNKPYRGKFQMIQVFEFFEEVCVKSLKYSWIVFTGGHIH